MSKVSLPQAVLLSVLALTWLIQLINAESTAVISPNGTVTAFRDPTTNTSFRCIVTEADGLYWVVDNTPVQDERIRNRGITVTELVTMDMDTQRYGSDIIIPNAQANIETTVICIASNIYKPDVNSDPVLLRLRSVQNTMTYSTENESSNNNDLKTKSKTVITNVTNSAITLSATSVILLVMASITNIFMS